MLALALALCFSGLAGALAHTCVYFQRLAPGTKYAIASPGWPLNYQANESCQWVAEAPADQRVTMECDDFNLPAVQSGESHHGSDVLFASESGAHVNMDGMPFVGQGVLVTSGNILNVELRTSSRPGAEGRFRCFLSATQDHQWEVVNRAAGDPAAASPEPCVCSSRLDGKGNALSGRITGGVETKPNEFPMMAALAEGSSVFCGAVLVSVRHALTSAHCLRGKSMEVVDMVVGDYDFSLEADGLTQQRHKLAEFIKNPAWSGDWKRANIAIARTKEDMRLSYFVTPACLPSRAADTSMAAADTLLALGWGAETYMGNSSARVKYMFTTVQENKECDSKYQAVLQDEHLCVGSSRGQAVCAGDPGGPLIHEDPKTHRLTVVGIIAYGEGCTGAPIINTRVASYIDWIRDVTANTTCSAPKT